MAVKLAFFGVIIIWSTTPLAIKWSGGDIGFLFGVTMRMILACVVAGFLVTVLRHDFSLSKKSFKAYLASGIGIYVAMLMAYWSASYMPSGWIALVWGISPVLAGIFGHIFLGENALLPHKMIGIFVGLMGLFVIFVEGAGMGNNVMLGVFLAFIGVIGQLGSAIVIKKIDSDVSGLVMTTGGLAVSIPLFVLTWLIFDGELPEEIPFKAGSSIVYLAMMGSVIGFSLYFYLLKNVEASKVALITLVTPVSALLLGSYLNNEAITISIIIGTGLILGGLASYQWGDKLINRAPNI
jgi:drug/metabolite transporter (DMT)-like permease